MLRYFALWALYTLPGVLSDTTVTVYNQIPLGQQLSASAASASSTAPGAATTSLAAYNNSVLTPPPLPNPLPANVFTVELQQSASSVGGLSIPQSGSFYGFSIEMSVVTQVLGRNSSLLQVPFLNLMSNIAQRSGSVHVRTGGNTQDYAFYVDEIPNSFGMVVQKLKDINNTNPTNTPTLMYNMDYFYLLSNISALVPVKWYLGIPFNDTTNWRLQIAQYGEAILGDNLLGFQIGNEPDLYANHQHRNSSYGPQNYFNEVGELISLIAPDDTIPVKNNLIGPGIQTLWTPEMVWDTGFIPAYRNNLGALAVEKYPDTNCYAIYGVGSPVDLPTEFGNFLNHNQGKNTVAPYLNSTSIAVQNGLPFLMFETNSASCGGFPGISDSYGAALWALDYGFTMAVSNFSGAMLHVGGQNVFYNPFTPPPTNQSKFHEWTIGAIYYSVLIMAEAFGPSNTSQIVDLNANSASEFTPGYAIYENGNLARVALFNYMDDPSGANNYNATLQLTGTAVPSSVSVKYLSSPSVATKDNITWAGQTLGTVFDVDGRLKGEPQTVQAPCDATANACTITVPAPGFALVFMNNDAYTEVNPSSTITFPTTAYTNTKNTAAVPASILSSSNGHSGKDRDAIMGSTSNGKQNAAERVGQGIGLVVTMVMMVIGTALVVSRS